MSPSPDSDQVLIFDLGGVLVEFQGFDALGRLATPSLAAGEIRSRWLGSEAVARFELGHISALEFARRFVEEWGLDTAPDEFLSTFQSWAGPVAPEGIELLRALAPRHRLACLSNCNETHWEHLQEPVGECFDAAFISFHMGLAKPSRRVFEHALRTLDVAPEQTTFFDDTEENIRVARDLGMRAELVRGVDELRRRLAELGML